MSTLIRQTNALALGVAAAGRRSLLPLGSILAVLAALELVARTGLIEPRYLPPPTEIAGALAERLGEGALWDDVGATLAGCLLGVLAAFATAFPLGVLIGTSAILHRLLHGPIELLRPIPSVALVPLAVLVLGSDLQMKVFLVAFAAFWPILIQTIYGIRDVDPQLLETARCLGLRAPRRLVLVAVPAAVPYVATGLRIAASLGLVLAVTAELVVGAPGLGRAITIAQSGGAVADMYALIVVTGLLGWALNSVLASVERRLLRWHVSYRGAPG